MATEQEVINAINSVNARATGIQSSLTSINNQIAAVKANPNDPDVQEKIMGIRAQYIATTGEIQNAYTNQIVALAEAYKTSSPETQKKLNDQYYASIAAVNAAQSDHSRLKAEELDDLRELNVPPGGNTSNQQTTTNKSDDDAGTGDAGTQENPRAYTNSPMANPNPLSKFASYNYQLTLYMITSDAYDAFVDSGRKNINSLQNEPGESVEGGAFIIAQSGGINKANRLEPAFHYDYYIDNLKFTSLLGGASAAETEITFNVYEPYGFSFLSNLRRAKDKLAGYNPSSDTTTYFNDQLTAQRQFFIIGIRFYGYDKDGNIVSTSQGDSTTTGVYEYFFDIIMNEVTFKLENKGTTYNCKAHFVSTAASLGTKRGTVKQGAAIEAATVEEAINQVKDQLNKTEKDNNKNQKTVNVYNVEWRGPEEDIKRMKEAKLVIPSDLIKASWASSDVKKTEQSNDAVSVAATPDKSKKQLTVKNGTAVVQVIEDIYKQSTYMSDALTVLNTTTANKTIPNSQTKNIKWIRVSSEVKGATWNKERGDWVYNITYIIEPYETPGVYSPFVNTSQNYYGPHKRYQYWFTGKNSEVLGFNIEFKVNYFQAISDLSIFSKYSEDYLAVPVEAGVRTDKPRMGLTNQGLEAQNQVLTSLLDPEAWANSRLTITGDPEFLISDTPSSLNQVYNQFYGANGAINPNGGYVFIEFDLKEAMDYDITTGLMKINDSVLFWQYPKSIADSIQGIILQVTGVQSKFEGGKFTQILETKVPGFTDGVYDNKAYDGVKVNPKETRQDAAKEAEQANADRQDTRTLPSTPNSSAPAAEGNKKPGSPFITDSMGLAFEDKNPLVTQMTTNFASNLPLPAPTLSTGDD